MTSASPPPSASADVGRIAREKLTKILGDHRAQVLLRRFVEDEGRPLMTADDLYELGSVLSKMEGIESAVGALLCTRAVMMGASPSA